jgi:hypothetical protein
VCVCSQPVPTALASASATLRRDSATPRRRSLFTHCSLDTRMPFPPPSISAAAAAAGAAAGAAVAAMCAASTSSGGGSQSSLTMRKVTRGQSLLTDRKPKVAAPLDPGFAPYALAKAAYIEACANETRFNYVRTLYVAVLRQNGLVNRLEFPVFPSSDARFNDSLVYAYFTIMFALCQKGGFKVMLCGPSDLCAELQKEFSPTGGAAFPVDLMSQVYDRPFEMVRVAKNQLPDAKEDPEKVGLDVSGCRLSFDLGKSDFKVVACIDGKPTYNCEHEWDIYQTNPEYHFDVVLSKMKEAAATMPRVDSVGGASAGVPIKNDCVWNDCFPRVNREDYKRVCFPFFKNLAKAFGDVPLKVMNDGEVTAVAGVQMLEQQRPGCTKGKGTFGISMGSNCGAGYMLPTAEDGTPMHPGWLNELWTAPVDFSPDAWECFVRLPPSLPSIHVRCTHARARHGLRWLVAGDRCSAATDPCVCVCACVRACESQFTAQDMIGMSSMCFGQQAACKLIESAGCAPPPTLILPGGRGLPGSCVLPPP